ncbi:hypothetical protein NIES3585_34430 [Nodularia sp. NIES-3585]|nr:hypothetical protein NIES3585_34430 [Nodularia sp. NIES-3585]
MNFDPSLLTIKVKYVLLLDNYSILCEHLLHFLQVAKSTLLLI